MPAQSPTLSPTLSAMVAGLRGSSSGMPASTLPTMSPPTSAPLVKMPPPRRAKIEISEAPKPSATSASIISRLPDGDAHAAQNDEVADHAQQREAGHQHAGDGARLEGEVEALPQALLRGDGGAHVGAHRHVHADEAGGARQHGADQEAAGGELAEQDEAAAPARRRRRWRWWCTGGADRPRRLPGSACAISCMRGVPASAAMTRDAVMMPYSTAITPQADDGPKNGRHIG